MDISPTDPVFGAASSPQADYPPRNGTSVGQRSVKNGAVESGGTEIGAITEAIEELQARLDRAHEQLDQAKAVRTTELEIDRLFVEAQRFSEASLQRLDMRVQEILVEAEAKATQILREATEEAQKIHRQAQQAPPIPTRTAQEVQSAIVSFTRLNSEFLKELNALNGMLTPSVDDTSSSAD
jgi:hypothetical protein